MNPINVSELGAYLREQRQHAQLSLRQLSEVAGISNPYLSQIERGLKRPSAEILQQLAKGLRISAESLYVRAGILEERAEEETGRSTAVPAAILADPRLTDRQRRVLLDVYASLVGDDELVVPPARTRRAVRATGPAEPADPAGTAQPAGPDSPATDASARPDTAPTTPESQPR
jgi:transcriptional regulator with XRE-family HTH domain